MKSDATYLRHILDMIGRIESATSEGRDSFLSSQLHQDAVLRNLHTLTETTQRLSSDLKSAHADIDWRKLAAFRNVLVHDYLGIDIELVWSVVSQDIPEFKNQISGILKDIQ